MKRCTSVSLDPDLVKEARRLNLNISRIAEGALKGAIRRKQGSVAAIRGKA